MNDPYGTPVIVVLMYSCGRSPGGSPTSRRSKPAPKDPGYGQRRRGGGRRFRYILAHCTDSAGISTASRLEEADWYSAVVVESN